MLLMPKRIDELEDNDLNNIDAVINHNLPNEFSYKGGVQNIGMFAYETNTVKYTGWLQNLYLMDKVVVFCGDQQRALPIDLQSKSFVLSHSIDTNKFDKTYELMDFDVPKNCVNFTTLVNTIEEKIFRV
jgi:hypothetical protein